MTMAEILGTGVGLDTEAREAFSAVGSTIALIGSILKQFADYAYRVSVWIVNQMQENPLGMIQWGFNIAILLS